MKLSVIICTHNPRRDYFMRVLAALENQTLPKEKWELVVVDNASSQPLAGRIDLSWHPCARIVREEQLGLTMARLRGVAETESELIVLVDDDNVLDSEYLAHALNISETWQCLGAWGGQIRGEFEEEPPEWAEPLLGILAIREVKEDRWSNLLHQIETTPYGAGLVIRRSVAKAYAAGLASNPDRVRLDRTGNGLSSCGDIDLAFTAIDIGLGTGLFAALKLTHLIPPNRLSEDYLLNLLEKTTYSFAILDSFRGRMLSTPRRSLLTRVHEWGHQLRVGKRAKQFELARQRGLALAAEALRPAGQE